MDLHGKKIAILVEELFNLFEFWYPYYRLKEAGAEVVVVPGNHERSVQPARLLLAHPRIHVIEEPRRVGLTLDGMEVSIFGFPFVRQDVRGKFERTLRARKFPVEISEIRMGADPLTSTARGAHIAAMFEK
jgi:hypothetical protein